AVMPEEKADVPWREMRYPALTVILDFPGSTLEHVLGSRDAVIHVYDPFKTERVTLRGASVPLAGNFTSGYGLWLARSSFARQSIGTLVGKGDMLESPRVYLMQPYQPDKKTVIMIHGLASSPEAWINVANEIMGDEALARNYQIWQVYYPTSFPLPVSNFEIRKALDQVISAMDPTKNAAASRDMVVVGQGTIVKVNGDKDEESRDEADENTIEVELKNGETIILKVDDDTKIAAGYFPQKDDVVEVTYGSTSLMLREIKLLDRKVEPEEDAAPDDSGEADDGDSGGTAPEGEGAEGEGAEG
ncbi:MAG: hypothetical protein IJM67_07590, partial [Atopobiaceae bacterium]|nr:hypothetical protein [Atopobiaceae bacterium]